MNEIPKEWALHMDHFLAFKMKKIQFIWNSWGTQYFSKRMQKQLSLNIFQEGENAINENSEATLSSQIWTASRT